MRKVASIFNNTKTVLVLGGSIYDQLLVFLAIAILMLLHTEFGPETSPTLKALVAGLANAAPTNDTPQQELVTAALDKAAAAHGWLPIERRRANHDRYARHLIYSDPRGRFSVLVIVWAPGQASPIHTHRVWSGVAVCEGTLTETIYNDPKGSNPPVVARHDRRPAGSSRFYPADRSLHQITNRSAKNAVSLHVYGISASLVSTGINRVFTGAV